MKYLVAGTLNYDITLFVSSIPKPGGETKVIRIKRALGGKGGNVATAFARIAGGASFLGAVGNDEIARMHVEFFKGINVDTRFLKVMDGAESGTSYVVVDARTGENVIMSYPGANSYLSANLVDEELKKELREAKLVVAANCPPDLAEELFRSCSCLRIYIPASHAPDACGRGADYIIVNESEGRMLRGCVRESVVRTLGERGAELIGGGSSIRVQAVDLAKHGLRPASTAGAGDAFAGAFAAALALGYAEEDALKLANYAAALKVTREDPRGSPSREELIKFLRAADPNFNLKGLSASLV
ncbi:MAG: carbohydrate kinase family protein [Nitrososphaeria archaeon]